MEEMLKKGIEVNFDGVLNEVVKDIEERTRIRKTINKLWELLGICVECGHNWINYT